jgi:hypothetical protein
MTRLRIKSDTATPFLTALAIVIALCIGGCQPTQTGPSAAELEVHKQAEVEARKQVEVERQRAEEERARRIESEKSVANYSLISIIGWSTLMLILGTIIGAALLARTRRDHAAQSRTRNQLDTQSDDRMPDGNQNHG